MRYWRWLAVLGACGGVGVAAVSIGSGALALALAITALLLASTPAMVRLRVNPLDALGLYALSVALIFGVDSLPWLTTPFAPPPVVTSRDVVRAVCLVGLSQLVFTIAGVAVGGPPRRFRIAQSDARPRRPGLLIMLIVVGSMICLAGAARGLTGYATALGTQSGASSTAEALLAVLTAAQAAILPLALIALQPSGRRYRLPLAGALLLLAAVGFMAGFKGAILLPFLYVAFVYVAIRGRIPWRGLVLGVAALVLVVQPANSALRNALQHHESPVGAAAHAATDWAAYRPDRSVSAAMQYLSRRFREIDQIALIVRETPSTYPYAHGVTYTPLLVLQAVPRVVWPGKVTLNQGEQFSHTYWQIPSSDSTATPLTQVGDLYRNFGLAGVVVGMFVVGVAVGLLRRITPDAAAPRAFCLYLFALANYVFLTHIESTLPVAIGSMLKTLPLAAIVILAFLRPVALAGGGRLGSRRMLAQVAAVAGVLLLPLAIVSLGVPSGAGFVSPGRARLALQAALSAPVQEITRPESGTGDVVAELRASTPRGWVIGWVFSSAAATRAFSGGAWTSSVGTLRVVHARNVVVLMPIGSGSLELQRRLRSS